MLSNCDSRIPELRVSQITDCSRDCGLLSDCVVYGVYPWAARCASVCCSRVLPCASVWCLRVLPCGSFRGLPCASMCFRVLLCASVCFRAVPSVCFRVLPCASVWCFRVLPCASLWFLLCASVYSSVVSSVCFRVLLLYLIRADHESFCDTLTVFDECLSQPEFLRACPFGSAVASPRAQRLPGQPSKLWVGCGLPPAMAAALPIFAGGWNCKTCDQVHGAVDGDSPPEHPVTVKCSSYRKGTGDNGVP